MRTIPFYHCEPKAVFDENISREVGKTLSGAVTFSIDSIIKSETHVKCQILIIYYVR